MVVDYSQMTKENFNELVNKYETILNTKWSDKCIDFTIINCFILLFCGWIKDKLFIKWFDFEKCTDGFDITLDSVFI